VAEETACRIFVSQKLFLFDSKSNGKYCYIFFKGSDKICFKFEENDPGYCVVTKKPKNKEELLSVFR
jgi:hypothetical protein